MSRLFIRRRLFVLGLSAAIVPLAWVAWRAFRAEFRTFRPSYHPPRLTLLEFGIPALRAVSFASRAGTTLRGFYAPSSNGAAVVLTHGSRGERSDVAVEAQALSAAGFGVLAFDWPGHGESEGEIRWGEPERLALLGALDWLTVQPSIDAARLGVYGFSMGGYTATQVAASDPRVQAVALAGAPHDAREQTAWEHRRWGVIARWPAFLGLQLCGMDLDDQVPERVIMDIAPRPVLVVSGSEDATVPPWMAQRLFDAARQPKQLLEIPGAAHGRYDEAAPERYLAELSAFFSRSLSA